MIWEEKHIGQLERKFANKKNKELGFQIVEVINQALAKQGWRIIQNQNFLMSRVLKSKYSLYLSYDFSSLSHNPPYIWYIINWGK